MGLSDQKTNEQSPTTISMDDKRQDHLPSERLGEGGVRDSRVVLDGHMKRSGGGMVWGRQVLELVHPELRAGVFIHCLLPAIRKTEIHWHR